MTDNNLNPAPNKSLRYAWYVVFILTLAYISSFIDRQVLNLLTKPMKRDLHLSDTQMGMLMGFSFAIFYTALGIPAGLMADTKNRRNIIIWGIGLWSLMTAMGGLAVNFGQFFLSRMGVGIGEAALSPSAYSMITDYFPKKKLATALSVYSMGIYIGSGIAILIGGVLAELSKDPGMINLPIVGSIFPWQSIFFLIGIPGFLIMLLMFTIKEPARTGLIEGQEKASFSEVLSYVKTNRKAFVLHSLGTGLIAMVTYSASSWIPAFLERVYDWTPQKVGIWFGSSIAIFSTLGIILGGRYADRLTKKGFVDADLRTARLAAMMLLGFGLLLPWFHSGEATFWIIIPMNFFGAFPFGATVAAIQKLMPGRMRSLGSAMYLLILNLVGIGIGPTLTGFVTQYVYQDPKMVGYSLMTVTIFATIISITCFTKALKPYCQSIKNLNKPLA